MSASAFWQPPPKSPEKKYVEKKQSGKLESVETRNRQIYCEVFKDSFHEEAKDNIQNKKKFKFVLILGINCFFF